MEMVKMAGQMADDNIPLADQPAEWKDAHGRLLIFCAIHEADPGKTTHRQAMVTIGGYSLCRDCYDTVIDAIANGKQRKYSLYSPDDVIFEMLRDVTHMPPGSILE
jgi:hypothetical protein